jgi:hypothetical protein
VSRCRAAPAARSPRGPPAAVQNPHYIAISEGFYMSPSNLLESNRVYRDSHRKSVGTFPTHLLPRPCSRTPHPRADGRRVRGRRCIAPAGGGAHEGSHASAAGHETADATWSGTGSVAAPVASPRSLDGPASAAVTDAGPKKGHRGGAARARARVRPRVGLRGLPGGAGKGGRQQAQGLDAKGARAAGTGLAHLGLVQVRELAAGGEDLAEHALLAALQVQDQHGLPARVVLVGGGGRAAARQVAARVPLR